MGLSLVINAFISIKHVPYEDDNWIGIFFSDAFVKPLGLIGFGYVIQLFM